jgi:hypothetical protein
MPLNNELPMSGPELRDLRARFHDDYENYQILVGERQGMLKGSSWDTDYTHEKYVAATDIMIGTLDGSTHERDIYDPDNPEASAEKPDTVIWLDKSARPVSWLVDALWEQVAQPDAEKPDYEFLNIDRRVWFQLQGYNDEIIDQLKPADFDIDKVPQDQIDAIRAYFTQGDLDEDSWREQVWSLPTKLDNQNVLIVDEVSSTGSTISIAVQLLKRAIPEATFGGSVFWNPGKFAPNASEAETQQMISAPIWYSKTELKGRGVGEISLQWQAREYAKNPTQQNLRNKIASFVLSAPHFDTNTFEVQDDPAATRLEQDFAYLSYALGDKKVYRRPSKYRDYDEYTDIVKEQGLTPRQATNYISYREQNPNTEVKKPRK